MASAPEAWFPNRTCLAGLTIHPDGAGWALGTWEPSAHLVRFGVGVHEVRNMVHTAEH